MMDRRAVELVLISLLAAFCGGLAWALDHELFAVAFAAAAVTGAYGVVATLMGTAFSLSLAKSQPEKSEATSDNEGDPAHPHRYRPVADDDGPFHENPHEVEQRHHGEDHPCHKGKRFASMSHHPEF